LPHQLSPALCFDEHSSDAVLDDAPDRVLVRTDEHVIELSATMRQKEIGTGMRAERLNAAHGEFANRKPRHAELGESCRRLGDWKVAEIQPKLTALPASTLRRHKIMPPHELIKRRHLEAHELGSLGNRNR
jgi:hypothetical protein